MGKWVWDLLAVVGGGLVTAGLAWIYPPLGLIFPGGVLIGVAIWGAMKWDS